MAKHKLDSKKTGEKKKKIVVAALNSAERQLMSKARRFGTGMLMKGWLDRLRIQEKNGLISPGERQRAINGKLFRSL